MRTLNRNCRRRFIGVILITALLLNGCYLIPSPVRSTSLPSKTEKKLNDRYIGKTFVTAEPSFLIPGVFPLLTKEQPRISSYLALRAGTPFEVKRIELRQGLNLVTAVGAGLGGTSPHHVNVFYVDIRVDTKVHRDVQIHLTDTSPSFRFDRSDAFIDSREFLDELYPPDQEKIRARRLKHQESMVALARETALANLDLHDWECQCLEVMNPAQGSSSYFGSPTKTTLTWKLPTGVTVKAIWKDEMPLDEPPLVEKHERDDS